MDVALREQIVRAVEDTLRARDGSTLGAATLRVAEYQPNKDAENAYLVGRNRLRRRGSSVREAVENFREAVRLDSLYPKAYSGLSLALALTPYYEPVPTRAVAEEATAAAKRALQLDSTLAEPHVALGLVSQHAFDWTTAQREFDLAVRLRGGGDAEPLIQYGRHLVFRGKLDDGLRQFFAARQTEPASAIVRSWIAYTYHLRNQQDSALAWSDSALRADSSNLTALSFGALVQLRSNRREAAHELALRTPIFNGPSYYVLETLGDTIAVRQRLARVDTSSGVRWLHPYRAVYLALARHDTAGALDGLEQATTVGEMWASLQAVCGFEFDELRGAARFAALLRRIGLAELAPPSACAGIRR